MHLSAVGNTNSVCVVGGGLCGILDVLYHSTIPANHSDLAEFFSIPTLKTPKFS